jgi:hypothetical protein
MTWRRGKFASLIKIVAEILRVATERRLQSAELLVRVQRKTTLRASQGLIHVLLRFRCHVSTYLSRVTNQNLINAHAT